ncbi:TPA: hypothetical protein QCP61_005764 [Bacillus cereus]|uniref:hypothetical protein n=1 Tax=Bacillus paranthracis TaxID=2026186 RepID=UPI002A80CC53|nr:hypothetical protein [Bacillus paranthracis]MDY4270460.1 hypothetical protein [Bacillus paranthracis]MDY4276162.1 hypothetical protein [Bacillus paranthracis]MDY4293367.1 hypothetical protein [Bacillus paranthracis]HDR4393594.1 hypothetical protein [Bacillus cereus]
MDGSKAEKRIISGNPVTIKAGNTDSLVIGPINDFRNFLFTTYEVQPEKSEVFLVGYDLKGSNSVALTFYNKGANDATIQGSYAIKV